MLQEIFVIWGFVMISVNTPSINNRPEGECFLLEKVTRLK